MTLPSAGFLPQGRRQFLAALKAAEATALEGLQQQLQAAADPEARRLLEERMEAVRAEFRRKGRASQGSLFAAP